jgi:hypothetical protein
MDTVARLAYASVALNSCTSFACGGRQMLFHIHGMALIPLILTLFMYSGLTLHPLLPYPPTFYLIKYS